VNNSRSKSTNNTNNTNRPSDYNSNGSVTKKKGCGCGNRRG